MYTCRRVALRTIYGIGVLPDRRVRNVNGSATVVIAFTVDLLEPDNDVVFRRTSRRPLAIDSRVCIQLLIEVELLTCNLTVAFFRIISSIPTVKRVAGSRWRCRSSRLLANCHKLWLGVCGVREVLIEAQPVALLGVGLECIGALFEIKGFTWLVKLHLTRNFGVNLLPAHKLGDNTLFVCRIRRIVLGNLVLGHRGIVLTNELLVHFYHQSELVYICHGIGLEDHCIVGHFITVADAVVHRDLHGITHLFDGLSFRTRIILFDFSPTDEDRAIRQRSRTRIEDVLIHVSISLPPIDHHRCGRTVSFYKIDR